jgi:hypothetical protein
MDVLKLKSMEPASCHRPPPAARIYQLRAGDPGKDVPVDLCGLFHVEEVADVLDHLHRGIRGEVVSGGADQIDADAAIGGSARDSLTCSRQSAASKPSDQSCHSRLMNAIPSAATIGSPGSRNAD